MTSRASFTAKNMAKAAKTYRYERKFLVSELTASEVEAVVKSNPAAFVEIYHGRYVNNIYCDSVDFSNYNENIDGVSQRLKVRIRWYGDLFGMVEKPVLEFKIKNGLTGRKDSYPLDPFEFGQSFRYKTFEQLFRKQEIPHPHKLRLYRQKPSLVNRYWRKYFLSADKKFRITLDTEVQFYEINSCVHFKYPRYTDFSNVVVELKYDLENDEYAHIITGYFPFRMTRNSKYISGMERK